jgi:threonyl-tRNA synthetase
VGDNGARAGKVSLRIRGKETAEDMPAAEFVEKIKGLRAEKKSIL